MLRSISHEFGLLIIIPIICRVYWAGCVAHKQDGKSRFLVKNTAINLDKEM